MSKMNKVGDLDLFVAENGKLGLGLGYNSEELDVAQVLTLHNYLTRWLVSNNKDAAISLPWRPIAELYVDGKYDHDNDDPDGLLLLAPELVDADCNTHGVGMGYWQDDGLTWHMTQEECDARDKSLDHGSFMACKWSMTNDEWSHVCCTPTHYLRLRGSS